MEPAGDYHEYDGTAEFYDSVVLYVNRQDIQFFVEEAKASQGPVLELGCGTGRVLIPTAREGVEITGLDRSAPMLRICRERLNAEPPEVRRRVQLVEGDMRSFSLERSYALITVPFRPFQHLTSIEDQLSCLRAIRRHLLPDGRMVLDVFNPWLELLVSGKTGEVTEDEPPFTMPDGRRVIRRHRFVSRDRANQVDLHEFIYCVTHPDGREECVSQHAALRYFFRFEVEHLLARAGLQVEHLYCDYDRSPFGTKYPGELIFVARSASAV